MSFIMNNKKTTSLLISLFVSLVFLAIIVFILSETSFLVGLNQKWLWLAALWLLPIGALLAPTKARSVIARLFLSKKSKKLILLTGANIILTGLFLLIYSIFQYGSPLIYENHPQSFRATGEIPLVENTVISQELKADSNNLGTVGVRLSVQEKTLGFNEEGEVIEIKPEKEIADEETQEEQVVDQADFTEDEREGLEKIAYYEPVEIIFRLKEKGGEDWLYENSYFFDQAVKSHLYPFGFPIIEESKDKTYVVEIEGQKEITPEEKSLYLFASVNKKSNPYFYLRYVYNRGELKEDIKPIIENTLRKILLTFKNNVNQVNLVTIFLLLEIAIYLFLNKDKKSFKEKASSFLSKVFLFILLIIIFIFFDPDFFNMRQGDIISNENLGLIRLVSINILLFSSLVIIFFNKKDIKKIASKKLAESKNFNYFGVVVLLTITGLLIRIVGFNLSGGILEDEFALLTSAEQYLREGEFQYARARCLTHIAAFFIKLFNSHSVFISRLPSVIFGALTIPLIYFLGKKINKIIGLISSYLWTFLPLSIGLSSYAREYSFSCFIICLSSLAFSYLIDLGRKSKLNFTVSSLTTTILLILIGYYSYVFGSYAPSTLSKFWFPISGLFLMFICFLKIFIPLINKGKGEKITAIIAIVILIFILFLLVGYLYQLNTNNLYLSNSLESIKGNPNRETLKSIFFSSVLAIRNGGVATWFSYFSFPSPFLIIFFLLPILVFYKNKYYISFLATFFVLYFSLSFLVKQHVNPRYVFYLFPFYVLSFSVAIFLFYLLINLASKRKKIDLILSLTLLLTVFSPIISIFLLGKQTTTAVYDKNKRNLLIGEPLRTWQKEENLADYIENYGTDQKFIVVTNQPSLYYFFYAKKENPKLINIYIIKWYENSKYWAKKNRSLSNLISGNRDGLIIISNNKNVYIEPKNQHLYGKEIIYLESLGSYHIFAWNEEKE